MGNKTAIRPFISYAREDSKAAMRLYNDLCQQGATPWIDQVNLLGGQNFDRAIKEALRTCSHFIALISEHSISKRGFVQKELHEALRLLEEFPSDAIFLVPVRLDESIPKDEHLRALHWVDLYQDYKAGFKKLLESMGVLREANEEATPSFSEWLDMAKCPARPSTTAEGLFQIGECTVLYPANSGQGFSELVLEQMESLPLDSSGWEIDDIDRNELERRIEELEQRKVRGTSMSLVQFLPGLSDDPPRLRYRVVDYKYARAFLSLQQTSEDCLKRYRPRTLRVLGDGYGPPNIVSTGLAVVVGTTESPELVLARRRERSGGFDDASWAVTIGEQFNPVTGPRGNKQSVERDVDIEGSCLRGLKEELLGKTMLPHTRISIHALVREDDRNNFIFIGLADLRPLSFGELATLWQNAEDAGEHTALVSVPLTKQALKRCIESAEVPNELLSSAEMSNRAIVAAGNHPASEGSRRWQANSTVRLALAHWLCDFETAGGD